MKTFRLEITETEAEVLYNVLSEAVEKGMLSIYQVRDILSFFNKVKEFVWESQQTEKFKY